MAWNKTLTPTNAWGIDYALGWFVTGWFESWFGTLFLKDTKAENSWNKSTNSAIDWEKTLTPTNNWS